MNLRYVEIPVKTFVDTANQMLDLPRKPMKNLVIGKFVITWGGELDLSSQAQEGSSDS